MASTWWFQHVSTQIGCKNFQPKTSFQKAGVMYSQSKKNTAHIFFPHKKQKISKKPFFHPSFPANPSKPPCAVLPSGSTGRIMAFLPVPHPLLRRHWGTTKRIAVKFYNQMGWKQSHRIHGIFAYIRMISKVIVGKYAMHWYYGNKKVHTKIVKFKNSWQLLSFW